MIAAAKTSGYGFAAFAEDLEKLSAEKLDSLIKLCAASSSETFQVYAGFTYRDEIGNTWLTFGRQIHWPKDDWWSSKAKGAIAIDNMIFPPGGQCDDHASLRARQRFWSVASSDLPIEFCSTGPSAQGHAA